MHTQISKFGVRTVTENTYIKSPICLVFTINIIMEMQKLVSPHHFSLFLPRNCFYKIKSKKWFTKQPLKNWSTRRWSSVQLKPEFIISPLFFILDAYMYDLAVVG